MGIARTFPGRAVDSAPQVEVRLRAPLLFGDLARMMAGARALARAFRRKRMLESGQFATIAELADYESVAPSFMTRVLGLMLRAP